MAAAFVALAWIAAAPLGIVAPDVGAGGALFLPMGGGVVGALLFWPRRPA